ncbi:MAG: hypothetical protein HY066_12150 [Betaproteobacteria bacterium]|nr:hypothetical protein [Betaproteobacteria bacterium]
MNAVTTRYELDYLRRSVADYTVRSLDLLKAIEETIDSLGALSEQARVFAGLFSKEAERIIVATQPGGAALDPDLTTEDALLETERAISALHGRLVEKRTVAHVAPELTVEDGVGDAYDEAIAQVADLHNAIDRLRAALGEHDAEVEGASGNAYQTPEALFADLDAE